MELLAGWKIDLGQNVKQKDAREGDGLLPVGEVNGLLGKLGEIGQREADGAGAQSMDRHNRLGRAENHGGQRGEHWENRSGNPHGSILPRMGAA
jgi:hypothetical protein